jgi:hypothetical protein
VLFEWWYRNHDEQQSSQQKEAQWVYRNLLALLNHLHFG